MFRFGGIACVDVRAIFAHRPSRGTGWRKSDLNHTDANRRGNIARKAFGAAARHAHRNKGHTLKNWFLLILMVVALLYAFPYHPDPQQQPVQLPAEAVPPENNRTNPYDKPPRPPKAQAPAPKFGGYPCIGDCSDDKAGYRWAEQNGITDPDSCTGNTGEFIEGCRVYARQRAAGAVNK